jgi:hypothetical protein
MRDGCLDGYHYRRGKEVVVVVFTFCPERLHSTWNTAPKAGMECRRRQGIAIKSIRWLFSSGTTMCPGKTEQKDLTGVLPF